MDDYPGNSHASRARRSENEPRERAKEQPKEETKKVTPVIEGEAKRRKKSLGKRFREIFGGGEARGVGQYVVLEVLIPALRDMIFDAGQETLRRVILGEDSRSARRGRPGGYGGYTPYNRYSSSSTPSWQRDRREEPRRDVSRRARAMHDFDEIVLDTRHEAELVLDNLEELIKQYGQATVTDLYDLVNITSSFADEKWGWTDLSHANVSHVRDGYLLNLPKPETLD